MLALGFLVGGFGWLVWLGLRNGPTQEARLRERALSQFRATKVTFPAHDLDFDGQRAEILGTRETKYLASLLASNYVLTISARMPDGVEYEFKSDSKGMPWVTCRSRSDAHAMRAQAAF